MTIRFDDAVLIETLEFIKKIIDDNNFSSFLWSGDINCDFLHRTGHVDMIDNFMNEKSLGRSWDNSQVDFTRCQ